MSEVHVRWVRPDVRLTRLRVDGAECAACGRPLRRGDLVLVKSGTLVHPKNQPCVPAWQTGGRDG